MLNKYLKDEAGLSSGRPGHVSQGVWRYRDFGLIITLNIKRSLKSLFQNSIA
jgi:hypothetical protein